MIIAKKKYYPFAFENTQNLVIFSMKVIVVERELLVSVNLSKSNSENLPAGNFLGHHEESFCPSLFNTYSKELVIFLKT